MARYIGSSCKMSRRIGSDLELKSIGKRDISNKCKLKVFPGQHGNKKKRLGSNYSLQLFAKQAIKYTYGIMDKQFKHLYSKISNKKGYKGELLLKLLESRLDNVIYRMGFASTRQEARQLVSHKSIYVLFNNSNRIVNIPSFIVKPNYIIKIKDKSKNQLRIISSLKNMEKLGFVNWIEVDVKNMCGTFLRVPERKELSPNINEQLVIELYSK